MRQTFTSRVKAIIADKLDVEENRVTPEAKTSLMILQIL